MHSPVTDREQEQGVAETGALVGDGLPARTHPADPPSSPQESSAVGEFASDGLGEFPSDQRFLRKHAEDELRERRVRDTLPLAGERGWNAALDGPLSPCVPDGICGRLWGGRYGVGSSIALGTMSRVNEGYDFLIQRRVVLKRLRADMDGAQATARFLREAQITAWLDHPNIAAIYDMVVPEGGAPELVMKPIKGRTLKQGIDDAGGDLRSLYELLTALEKVSDAIQFAHDYGVVHRDLKPQNIMTGTRGEVYVMDWGIAKVLRQDEHEEGPPVSIRKGPAAGTITGAILGSPAYLSPEQARGDLAAIDERTDVFGLGAVLYEVLTGVAPYGDESPHSVIERAIAGDIVRPRLRAPERAIRPDLDTICMKALSVKRAERFQSAAEFRRGLREAILHGSWFETRVLPAGQVIVAQGEPSREAFLIERGTVEVSMHDGNGEHVIRRLGPGEVFGEAGLFTGQPRSATVRAIDDVELQCIDEQSLKWAFAEGSPLGILTRALADRFLSREKELMAVAGPVPTSG